MADTFFGRYIFRLPLEVSLPSIGIQDNNGMIILVQPKPSLVTSFFKFVGVLPPLISWPPRLGDDRLKTWSAILGLGFHLTIVKTPKLLTNGQKRPVTAKGAKELEEEET